MVVVVVVVASCKWGWCEYQESPAAELKPAEGEILGLQGTVIQTRPGEIILWLYVCHEQIYRRVCKCDLVTAKWNIAPAEKPA